VTDAAPQTAGQTTGQTTGQTVGELPTGPGGVALVTGAGGGIGSAIVGDLVRAGYTVAACDLDLAAASAAHCHAVQDLAGQADSGSPAGSAYGMDISDSDQVREVVARITADLGPIRVLVNNAGIDKIEPFTESVETTWRRIIEVNYLGTVIVTRAVLDGMIGQRYGRIVSIASDAGRVGSSGEVVYSGTKGAVIAFTKALAREVATSNITANTVCPGPTDTPLLDQVAQQSQKRFEALARAVPMKRIATPADVAPAVTFFAHPHSAYITGQTLSVSGGLTMA
jgi:2-hydroxycyclohexanecarboxyl-CoA dehydrogenase